MRDSPHDMQKLLPIGLAARQVAHWILIAVPQFPQKVALSSTFESQFVHSIIKSSPVTACLSEMTGKAGVDGVGIANRGKWPNDQESRVIDGFVSRPPQYCHNNVSCAKRHAHSMTANARYIKTFVNGKSFGCLGAKQDGCPARIRTWVKGFKVLCATATLPGSELGDVTFIGEVGGGLPCRPQCASAPAGCLSPSRCQKGEV